MLSLTAQANGVSAPAMTNGVSIYGTNPMKSDVQAALPHDTLRRIACQESHQTQFVAAPNGGTGQCPLYSMDNMGGVGVMQITRYRTDDEVWNWTKNVSDGVGIFNNEKVPAAEGYPDDVRQSDPFGTLVANLSLQRQEQGLSPVTVSDLPDFTTNDDFNADLQQLDPNLIQLQLDSIRAYNGYGGYDDWGFHLHEFQVAVDDDGNPIVGADGKFSWVRVPASERLQTYGIPDYVNLVISQSPTCPSQ